MIKKERFYSLDVFRGMTVALMIMVNNPGSWSHMYAPLKHAPWNGWTPTDLVFPFFYLWWVPQCILLFIKTDWVKAKNGCCHLCSQ